MILVIVLFASMSIICAMDYIKTKDKSSLKFAILCIVLMLFPIGTIHVNNNLEMSTSVIECVVVDKRTDGYLGNEKVTTCLYNNEKFKIKDNSLFSKVNKGDKIEIVVNFIDFNENGKSIQYVTMINE